MIIVPVHDPVAGHVQGLVGPPVGEQPTGGDPAAPGSFWRWLGNNGGDVVDTVNGVLCLFVFEAMRRQLENYGVTAEFPADKPSLAESIYGIEHDVLIGDAPDAVRYLKWQESPYANGAFELTLESETLVHKVTGNNLAFKIFISDYISGLKHENGNFSLSLEFRGEKDEVEAMRKAIAPVLEKYDFQSQEIKKGQIIKDNLEEITNKHPNSELMTNNINFDELAANSFAPTAGESDFENLFAAVFSLPEWYFIADEAFEYKIPYCAMFPEFFGEEIALTVFTDGARARKFIAEKGIKTATAAEQPNAPEDLILRISTTGILDFFDRLAPLKITKIFFNPNKDSQGFHHDLKMMRPIYEHLENKNLLAKNEPAAAENDENHLAKLLAENADVIADFDRENELLSSMIAGSAAAMDDGSEEDKARVVENTAEMFKSLRDEYQMPPKLFRAFIESCLSQRKLLMPVLAFAYLQQDQKKWEKLTQDREFIDEYAKWTIKKFVPGADLLMNEPAQTHAAASDSERNAESGVDFDSLARRAMETNAMEDLNALFGAAFTLPHWNFIARGEIPDVYPYIASNPAAGNQPMIRAFTNTDRLMRFARENNLTDMDGSAKVLTIPTENIVSYLENFTSQGAYGVWFNSDSESADFFIPIKQLEPIKAHLAKLNPPAEKTAETEFTALILTISDGLMMPSGMISKSTYNCNFFCWIPRDWTENLQLKAEYLEKLYAQFYGANWRAGNSDGSRYVVLEANSAVISPERTQNTKWNVAQNTELNHYWFYIGEGTGTFKNVTADEFQANFDAYFQAEATEKQDDSANSGASETSGGGFDSNLTINKVGTVHFDTQIAAFYEAVVPYLQDFQGTGEYLTLLRFEESGKSQEFENIASNSHGAYLQIRRFLYVNPKNGVRIGVNSIHSNHLRHVRTQSELKISFELCKNLDNQTGVFYHAFQGAREDVLRLQAAIQPILESVNYQAVQ